jgi:hypothetical protein
VNKSSNDKNVFSQALSGFTSDSLNPEAGAIPAACFRVRERFE